MPHAESRTASPGVTSAACFAVLIIFAVIYLGVGSFIKCAVHFQLHTARVEGVGPYECHPGTR